MRVWKRAVLVGILAAVCLSGLYRCPIKLFSGVDCPGCGMSRAFLAALRLDLPAAFHYHPLFWLVGLEILYLVFREPLVAKFPRIKNAELAVGILSLALLFVVWIVRQWILL